MSAELERNPLAALIEALDALRAVQYVVRHDLSADPRTLVKLNRDLNHAVALIESVVAKGR